MHTEEHKSTLRFDQLANQPTERRKAEAEAEGRQRKRAHRGTQTRVLERAKRGKGAI